jgi:hypothetical protein
MKKRNGPWTADEGVPGERRKKKKRKRTPRNVDSFAVILFFFPLLTSFGKRNRATEINTKKLAIEK